VRCYYSSTFTAAAEAGPKSAVRFMQEFGDEFKQTIANTAELRYGLMTFQAVVRVQSFHNNPNTNASAVKLLKTLRKV
jgi:conjugal transfer mating pair stabilization protein TraG